MIMKNVKQQQKLGFHQNFTSSILVGEGHFPWIYA